MPALRPRVVVSVLILCALQVTPLFAQQPKVLAPHKPVAPKMTPVQPFGAIVHQSAVGGLWMTDNNMKSTLYLKSDVKTNSLTITPILYLSNGVRYALDPVTLEPAGIATVDINQGLAKQGIAPYATLYGYVELDYQWPWAAVCATIRNVDFVNSVIFTTMLQPPPEGFPKSSVAATSQPTHSFEGLWWKQEKDVSGFVALANITEKPINATLRLTDNIDAELQRQQVIVSPHGTKMVTLTQLMLTTSVNGGIYVTHDGIEHGLVINGGLEDRAVGYSARLPLMPSPQTSQGATSTATEFSLAELGLMNGAADPMMNFPLGTTFTPYSVARNISDQAVTVTPTLWWMAGGVAQSARLPQVAIAGHRTMYLDVPTLITAAGLKNFNGSVNIILDAKGQNAAVVMASGSVDRKNTYVFEVIPRGVAESAAKSISRWSTGEGDDTMITLWNPADEDQDLVFTIFFSGGHYLYPIHLAERATRTFNVSEITRSTIPDVEGNTIPAGIREGSAEVAGSQGEHQHILVSTDAGIYNVNKAVCSPTCENCQGEVNSSFVTPGFSVPIGGSGQQHLYMQWSSGTQYDLTSQSSWTSNATNIATVTAGLVYGRSLGSVTISALDSTNEPPYIPSYCYFNNPNCPAGGPLGGSGTGNTNPTVTIDSFSPNPIQAGAVANAHITVNPSANVDLAITSSGTGRATFGTSGNTTHTIPDTTTVNITGGSLSTNGAVDLILTASYQGSLLASQKFSVTSGACTATLNGHGGDGPQVCPSTVNVYDSYNLVQFCPTCTFTCVPVGYDSTFTPDGTSPCYTTIGGVAWSGNQVLQVTARGNFHSTDCLYHYLQIRTTFTDANGITTQQTTPSGVTGLKCNANAKGLC